MERSEIMEGDSITKLQPNTVLRRRRRKRKSRDKPMSKPVDVEAKVVVVGAGSKESGMVQPAGERKKLATLRLSNELMEYIRTREVMVILATETPRPTLGRIAQDLFGLKLADQIAAEYEETKEFDADVLYQYRTKGYAEVQYVVTDDEEV